MLDRFRREDGYFSPVGLILAIVLIVVILALVGPVHAGWWPLALILLIVLVLFL
jgi:fatty acid desaturase